MKLKTSVNILLGGHLGDSRRLLQAADRGDAKAVAEIIARHPQLASFGGFHHNNTALHRAAKLGNVEVCRAVLEPLYSRVAAAESSPSHHSAGGHAHSLHRSSSGHSTGERRNKYAKVIDTVLDQRSGSGLTALMLACQRGHVNVAAYLLQQGADPTLVEWTTMRSCLHYASLGGHVACLRLLCSDETRWAPRIAPPPSSIDAAPPPPAPIPLRDVILHDVQVGQAKYIDLRSYGGLTPLHCCVVTGRLDAVRVLLQAGAAIMVRTDGDAYVGSEFLVPGSTPLHMAVLMGHASIAHALLQAHHSFMSAMGRGLDARGRRPWEGSSRSDIRSVRNSLRRLPYHLARERGFTALQALVDPRVPIDVALDASRDSTAGIGPKRLSTLCSVCLQQTLLSWLDGCELETQQHAQEESKNKNGASRVVELARTASRTALEAILRTPEPSPRGGDVTSSGNSILTTMTRGASMSLPVTPARPLASSTPPMLVLPGLDVGSNVGSTTMTTTSTQQQTRKGSHVRAGSAAGEMFGFAPPTNFSQRERISANADRNLHAYAGMLSVRRPSSLEYTPDELGWPPRASGASITLGTLREGIASSAIHSGLRARRSALPSVGGRQALPISVTNALTGVAGNGSPAPPPPPPRSPAVSSPFVPPGGSTASPITLVVRSSSISAGVPTVRGVLQSLRSRGRGSPADDHGNNATNGNSAGVRTAHAAPPRESSPPGGEDDKLRSVCGADKDMSSLDDGSCSGADSTEDLECGVCLDHKVEVAFAGCEHALCLSCARHLTQAGKKPPHCPFCRRMVVGFTRVTPTPGSNDAMQVRTTSVPKPQSMIVNGMLVG